MAPRRTRKNIDLLGTHIQTNGKYLVYKHPITGKRFPLSGMTRNEAIVYAHKLNAEIGSKKQYQGKDHMPDFLDRFTDEFLPSKEYAKTTLSGALTRIKRLKIDFDGQYLQDLTVIDLKNYFAPYSPYSRKPMRLLWIEIYKFAISEDLCENNLAKRTLTKKIPKRKRERLTIEQFEAIYIIAPEWLQIAMRACLLTLQRRIDLINIQFTDYSDGVLSLIQSKTGTGLHITAHDELDELFARSKKTLIPSPYLIHKKPIRCRREYLNKKNHWTQVNPEMLTRTFKQHRDKCKIFDGIKNKPTWYEIKSLGGRLLIQQGYSEEFVQQLMGHKKLSTTQIYLNNGVEWKIAETGLKL